MKTRVVVAALLAVAFFSAPETSQARWLNANAGRFQTMDSYEGDQTTPKTLHKYLYAQANPVNQVDPSGHLATTTETLNVSAIQAILIGFTIGATIHAIDLADATLSSAADKRTIEQFVATPRNGALRQADFDALERQMRRRSPGPSLYLHYSFDHFAASLVENGLWPRPYGQGTRRVYQTGWRAHWYLALPSADIQNAVYVVRPKVGYEGTPVFGQRVEAFRDDARRIMPGGGREWIFTRGSGGAGTVFGPIPVPIGHAPGPIRFAN